MDYDLTRLGPREFEHLTQALCSAVFGARVQTFGDGPDGGREATINGRLDWAASGDGSQQDQWDGYTVVQAKFRLRSNSPDSDRRWLLTEVRKELSRWAREPRRSKKPDNLLIVTNVVLSPGDGAGIDSMHQMIATMVRESALDLRAWHLWHYDMICTLLDVHRSVRLTYGGFLTTGDVLAHIDEWLDRGQTRLGDALTMHAVKDMLAQQYVSLGQAGDSNEDRLPLHSISIDLPGILGRTGILGRKGDEVNAAKLIVDMGERIFDFEAQKAAPHILLIGGPGQGKSTLTQMVCQFYRIALLREASLSPESRRLLDRLTAHFDTIGLAPPDHLRWPIRIALSYYGDYVANNPNISLLRYLAETISSASPYDITGADLQDWLSSWPWLLALDGMDEVVSPSVREKVSRGISEFLVEAAHAKADVLLVITTRPQGYLGEFGSEDYTKLVLRDLNRPEALAYAHKLTAESLRHDPDREREVNNRISLAIQAPETSRLMQTPLQITIMTLLLEHRQRVPSDRYQLFHTYFETIYSREANKPTNLGHFLEEHKTDIQAIHETIALVLQQQAETVTEHEGSLPATDFNEHAFARLRSEENDPEKARELAYQMSTAATHRLVLLVPSGDNGVGFEVRSLQEYLAARALTRAEGPEVLENLRPLIPSAHWRNTWLLAAGRLFTYRQGLRAQLISMLREFDNINSLSWLVRAGAELATDLLADDIAIKSPKYRRLLADQVLGRLNGLPDGTWRELADLLTRLANEDKLIQQKIKKQIMTLLTAEGGPRAHAQIVLSSLTNQSNEFKVDAQTQLAGHGLGEDVYRITAFLNGPQSVQGIVKGPGPELTRYLTEHLADLGGDDRAIIMRLFNALPNDSLMETPKLGRIPSGLLVSKSTPVTDYGLLQEAFSNACVAEAYSSLVESIPASDWSVAVYLRDIARAWYARRVTSQNT